MKTESYPSFNYDYTGRSVIIQQQQIQEDPHQIASVDQDLRLSAAPTTTATTASQYVVGDTEQSNEDVAIVSSSAPSRSVGRSCSSGVVVAGVGDTGEETLFGPRYPTIKFAGSVSNAGTTVELAIAHNQDSKPAVVPAVDSSVSVILSNSNTQQQVIIKGGQSKRKREPPGEYRKSNLCNSVVYICCV